MAKKPSLIKIYLELSKTRILVMQLVTLGLGFALAWMGPMNWGLLGAALLGTALTSAGAAALNHCVEVDIDQLMDRTKNRPIPKGYISHVHAALFGVVLSVAGVGLLFLKVNALTAILSLLTILLYVVVYTPMKRWSWLNTLVGAIPGAIPPLGGWAAATGDLPIEAWVLFTILFIWQLPHFYAIAWMFKDDYKKAGLKMLSVMDPTGDRTARQILLQSVLLLAISLYPFFIGMLGVTYLVGAFLLGLWMLSGAWKFNKSRSHDDARGVLKLSVFYLPLLLLLILVDTWII